MAEITTKVNSKIPSKFDYTGIDTRNIDPDRIPLGTQQQDCSLIAQTFERAAHSIPSEAAVFATLTRSVQNNKSFSATAGNSLKSYLSAPSDSANRAAEQASKFSPNVSQGSGASSQTDNILQALNIGTQSQSANTDSFGDKLMKWARDCIPCSDRTMAFLELHPNIDLLGVLDKYSEDILGHLNNITDLLQNVDIYGDFCELLNLLSFMCIPDLQRIISLLMSLFMLHVPKLDGMIDMLQSLIAPIFAPLLMSITSLLDQFTVLVTGPLGCVVDAINAQLKELSLETASKDFNIKTASQDQLNNLDTGLKQLNAQIQDGIAQIETKLNFYISQVKAMLGDSTSGDSAYLKEKLFILQTVRMVSFITAIITALSKGHAACSSPKTAEKQELDNFFDNFLNPQSSFNLWVDDSGQIHVDEKLDDFTNAIKPPNLDKPLPEIGNVLQFEGKDLLDDSSTVQEVATKLLTPSNTVIPCKLERTAGSVEQVNEWISELNKIS